MRRTRPPVGPGWPTAYFTFANQYLYRFILFSTLNYLNMIFFGGVYTNIFFEPCNLWIYLRPQPCIKFFIFKIPAPMMRFCSVLVSKILLIIPNVFELQNIKVMKFKDVD